MKKLNKMKVVTAFLAVPLLSIFVYPVASNAAGPVVNQGSTTSFAVLAGTTITNTGATVITGTAGSEIGVSPSSAFVGFPPGTAGGQHANDATAIAAQTSFVTAYSNTSTALPSTTIAADLNSQVLTAGSYNTAGGAFSNSGTVTFNAQGDPTATFVIQAASTFISSNNSTMVLSNGAQACNIFWSVGSSATLAGGSTFLGHLYAQSSITLVTGAKVRGNLIAHTGAVTLDSNTITNDNCAPAVVSMPPPAQTSSITSVTPVNCVVTGTTPVIINGNFLTPITNVTVNGKALVLGSWIQTSSTLTFNAVTSSTIPTTIQLYNGQAPLLVVQNFTCAPGAVVLPIPPVVIIPPGTGTIHVIKMVDNTYGGTATAADFTLSLRHHGIDVLGSPDVGLSAPGRTYILAPGTYVLGEEPSAAFPNYISSFKIVGQASNNINLKSGDDLTIVETNTELPKFTPVVPVVTPTPPTHTVTGGKLPKTASPWYNMLLLSVGLALLGGCVALFGKTARANK